MAFWLASKTVLAITKSVQGKAKVHEDGKQLVLTGNLFKALFLSFIPLSSQFLPPSVLLQNKGP